MSDDEATFIRTISETPGDETARLVYSDWLDDRDDPRAEYLRAEAAWVALQPTDEQYRPLHRRLSQLAAALDPQWFTDVSRMGHIVRRAWEPLAEGFGPRYPVLDLSHDWQQAVASLRELLSQTFGTTEVARRLCLPVDLTAFLCVIRGARDGREDYFDIGECVDANWRHIRAFDRWVASSSNGVPNPVQSVLKETGLWLQFGSQNETEWCFVCCDLVNPLFGVVVKDQYHPWAIGCEACEYCGRNLLHFLTGYRPVQKQNSGAWPLIPHSEWPTA